MLQLVDVHTGYGRSEVIHGASIEVPTDGVAAVIEKLKGHPLFAHITLLRSERSPIAALVTEMLEEISPGALP